MRIRYRRTCGLGDVPESLVEVHGVGDGVVPLQGDHSCNNLIFRQGYFCRRSLPD